MEVQSTLAFRFKVLQIKMLKISLKGFKYQIY